MGLMDGTELELSDDERARLSGGRGLDEPRMVGGAREAFDTAFAMEPRHGAALPPPQEWEHPEYADMGLRRRPVGGVEDSIRKPLQYEANPDALLRQERARLVRQKNGDVSPSARLTELIESVRADAELLTTRDMLQEALRRMNGGDGPAPKDPAPQPEAAPSGAQQGGGLAAVEDGKRRSGFAFPEGGSTWDVEEYRRAVAARRGGMPPPSAGIGGVRFVPVSLAVAAPTMDEDPFA